MASADGYQLILEANHVLATLAVEAINDGVVDPSQTVLVSAEYGPDGAEIPPWLAITLAESAGPSNGDHEP